MENKAESPDDLLDLQGIADAWNCSLRHVQNLWATRQIPGIKIGKLVRFRRSDITAYLDANRVEAV